MTAGCVATAGSGKTLAEFAPSQHLGVDA